MKKIRVITLAVAAAAILGALTSPAYAATDTDGTRVTGADTDGTRVTGTDPDGTRVTGTDPSWDW